MSLPTSSEAGKHIEPDRSTPHPTGGGASRLHRFLRILGPGLITGAADDDPSGIGTYSVTGARFGYGLLWLGLLCTPLMIAVQEMCGRMAATTGKGLAAVIKEHYPAWMLYGTVATPFNANN